MGLRRKCVRRQEALPTCSRWPPSWPPPQVFSFKAECPRPGGGGTLAPSLSPSQAGRSWCCARLLATFKI